MSTNLSLDQLKRAVQLKEQVITLEAELSSLFEGNSAEPKPAAGSGMSASTRARLSALGKARWAKIKAGNKPAASVQKKSPGLTTAGRARLSALMKARWAAKRGGVNKPASVPKKGSTLSPAARKKISDAAKARWARIKGGKSLPAKTVAASAGSKGRKPMSAAQKARIAATLKARWARIKAAGK